MNVTRMAAHDGAAVVGRWCPQWCRSGTCGHWRCGPIESELAAALLPVLVDGLLVSAAAVVVTNQTAGRRPRMSAQVAFAGGCAATVGGNIASARPSPIGCAVAAWAPLALLLVTEMLARPNGRTASSASVIAPDVTSTPELVTVKRQPAQRSVNGHRRNGAPRRRSDAPERVAAAVAGSPDASVAELARLAGVTRSIVRRVNGESAGAGADRYLTEPAGTGPRRR